MTILEQLEHCYETILDAERLILHGDFSAYQQITNVLIDLPFEPLPRLEQNLKDWLQATSREYYIESI